MSDEDTDAVSAQGAEALSALTVSAPTPTPTPLRFAVGDRVACATTDGWALGEVTSLHWRHPDWPPSQPSAPYEVQLDVDGVARHPEGVMIFAPQDHPQLIVSEAEALGQGDEHQAWHAKAQSEITRGKIADAYPARALHAAALFDASEPAVERFFKPQFLAAVAGWRSTGDARAIELAVVPGLRIEAPGVVSFECATDEFCEQLLEEVRHYQASGLPARSPNSMNNYGLVLNEIGMRPVFTMMLQKFMGGIGARFFGDDEQRQQEFPAGSGVALEGFADWGGSTLSEHHTFVVRYRPDEDRQLDMHVDECDVTFNFGLGDGGFAGSDLAFCGMYGSEGHRKATHVYAHEKGRCVVHSGKRRHGALPITEGERSSLILWSKSPAWRETEAYETRWKQATGDAYFSGNAPDAVCLSATHDKDFEFWRAKLGGAEGAPELEPEEEEELEAKGV